VASITHEAAALEAKLREAKDARAALAGERDRLEEELEDAQERLSKVDCFDC
jgi:predicted nuclease with TOPRIM domain